MADEKTSTNAGAKNVSTCHSPKNGDWTKKTKPKRALASGPNPSWENLTHSVRRKYYGRPLDLGYDDEDSKLWEKRAEGVH